MSSAASEAGPPPAANPVLREATVERIVEHTPDTRSLLLRMPAGQTFRFTPGQFLSLLLPVGGGDLVRPYSIASDPEGADVLEICFNLVPGGLGSQYLFGLTVGAPVRFTGPWGTFTLGTAPDAEMVFLADGTGIAPIRPMLRRALAAPGRAPVRLHYRAATERDLLYRGEFEAWTESQRRFTFERVLASGSEVLLDVAHAGYVAADADRSRVFYICGVGSIVTQLRDLLRGAGYARRAVQYEKW